MSRIGMLVKDMTAAKAQTRDEAAMPEFYKCGEYAAHAEQRGGGVRSWSLVKL